MATKKQKKFKLVSIIFLLVTLLLFIVVGVAANSKVLEFFNFSKADYSSNPLYVIGDSITLGHKDCMQNGVLSITACAVEPNTYGYLYATDTLSNGTKFYNLGYSTTPVSCLGDCSSPPNTDGTTSGFNNKFNNPGIVMPQTAEDMIRGGLGYSSASGEQRLQGGEFNSITNATVILAYGRNDINIGSISLDKFYSSYKNIVDNLASRNSVIILTIPPQSDAFWSKYQQALNPQTKLPAASVELLSKNEYDTFFSSRIWKIAYEKGLRIAPVHEYLKFTKPSNYYSTDEIHPSAAGHHYIRNVLQSYQGTVTRLDASAYTGKFILITANAQGYGQIVTETTAGELRSAEAFEVAPDQPYLVKVMGPVTHIYAAVPISISENVAIDTRSEWMINGKYIDSVTAYGRMWNWDPNNHAWLSNGMDIISVARYAQGPCAGRAPRSCVFDSRTSISVNGAQIESVTAYGRGWNWNPDGSGWANNGFDLTSIPRYAQGPCAGKAAGTCTFDSRTEVMFNNAPLESITAYGRGWNWNADGSSWPNNGFDLTSIPRYAQGPCANYKPSSCDLGARSMLHIDGVIKESVINDNGQWTW